MSYSWPYRKQPHFLSCPFEDSRKHGLPAIFPGTGATPDTSKSFRCISSQSLSMKWKDFQHILSNIFWTSTLLYFSLVSTSFFSCYNFPQMPALTPLTYSCPGEYLTCGWTFGVHLPIVYHHKHHHCRCGSAGWASFCTPRGCRSLHQGTCLGWGFHPSRGACGSPSIDVSLSHWWFSLSFSLRLPPSLSLSISSVRIKNISVFAFRIGLNYWVKECAHFNTMYYLKHWQVDPKKCHPIYIPSHIRTHFANTKYYYFKIKNFFQLYWDKTGT